MGHKYKFKNSEEEEKGTVAFKENLLWELIRFVMKSLPNKRPISIEIDKDDYNEKFIEGLK